MMKTAKAAGAMTSFDLNFREKLWKISGGADKAVETIATIVKNVDVLIGNEEDLQKGLGIPGPTFMRSRSSTQRLLRDDRQRGQEASACEDRGDHAARGALHQPAQLERGGVDRRQDLCRADGRARRGGSRGRRRRICGGIHLRPADRRKPEDALKLGWAHGALLTTFIGDTTMATLDQVRAFAKGGSARIQR
jgi:2-dehydro-3-deoxygluconokinase